MSSLRAELLKVCVLAVLFPFSLYAGEGEQAEAIAADLLSFSERLDELAAFEELGSAIPFTQLSPSDALQWDVLFKDSLGAAMEDALMSGELTTLAALESAIDNADTTVGQVSIQFENVSATENASNAALTDLSFDVQAQRNVQADLEFADDDSDIDLNGGSFEIDLALGTTLNFQHDEDESDSLIAFYLTNAPSIAVTIDASAQIAAFFDVLGFTSLNASGNAMLNMDIGIDWLDPDGSGQITLDEILSTAFADQVTVAYLEEPGSEVDIALALSSDLVPQSQATITLVDADLTDGLNDPMIDLSELDAFRNISPTEILSGLGELLCGVGAAQAVSDIQLPFLQQSIGDTVTFIDPLMDFVRHHTDATIVCGLSDTDPPLGNILDLSAGDEFYCQANVLRQPVDITWSISNAVIISDPKAMETVGTNPTGNVHFQMTADGLPGIELRFADPEDAPGVYRTVQRTPLTAQELQDRLADVDIAGFTSAIQYDPSTRSLTYRLHKDLVTEVFGDDEDEPAGFDFADRLEESTRLTGLGATADASVEISPQNAALDLTFGVILVPDIEDITPGVPPEDDDRFFLQARTGQGEHELQVDVTVSADVHLEGRVGFLEVTVAGDPDANPNGGAFDVGPSGGGPMFAVDIDPQGGIPIMVDGSPVEIPDALHLRTLLEDIQQHVQADVNIQMTGGLKGMVSFVDGVSPVEGSFSINWPDITDSAPEVTPDPDFLDALCVFDTDPSIFGSHSGGQDSAMLIDGTVDFTADLLGRTVRNIADASQCVITEVVNGDTLACALDGGDENDWDPGDDYEIVGNPLDLMSILLDRLDDLVRLLDGLSSAKGGSGLLKLDENLPLLGIAPKDLLDFLSELEDALDEIRVADSEATIICELTNPVEGVPIEEGEMENLIGLPPGTSLSCRAIADEEANGPVQWIIVDLIEMTETSMEKPASSVGSSPDPVELVLENGGTLGEDFEIRLTYGGAPGCQHTGALPPKELSLQVLEEAIENGIGLGEDALRLELVDLPLPGGDGVMDLVLRLGFGQCTADSPLITCPPGARQAPKRTEPFNLGLDSLDLPDFVGIEGGDTELELQYAALAQLDLMIPLSLDFDPDNVRVLDTSGVTLQVGAEVTGLDLMANLGPLMIGANGQAKTGAGFTLQAEGFDKTPNNESLPVEEFVDALTAELSALNEVDCGTIIIDREMHELNGHACASLVLDAPKSKPAEDPVLGFVAEDIADPDSWEVHASSVELSDLVDLEAMALELLLEAFDYLFDQVGNVLEGGGPRISLPLVGERLDGGAGVCSAVNDSRDGPLDELVDFLKEEHNVGEIRGEIQGKFLEALCPPDDRDATCVLLDVNDDMNVDEQDIVVQFVCDGADCDDEDTPIDIEDVRVRFLMGQGAVGDQPGCTGDCATGQQVDIDFGLTGLPLSLKGTLQTNVGWQFLVDFGMSRDDGPYIVAAGPDHGDDPEVQVGASVSLGMEDCSSNLDGPFPSELDMSQYSMDQCLLGTLGFLEILARDGNGMGEAQPSQMSLLTNLNVISNSDRIGLAQLTGGQSTLKLAFNAGARSDLLFRTGFAGPAAAQLPTVIGTVHMGWDAIEAELDTNDGSRFEFNSAPNVEFGNLYLDGGAFFSEFIEPLASDIEKATRPFKPIVEVARAPIPLITQLSKMFGGEEVRMLDLLVIANGNEPLPMIENLILLVEFVDNIPSDEENLFVPLGSSGAGSFAVKGDQAVTAPMTADKAGKIIEPDSVDNKTGVMTEITTQSIKRFSFPFLEDSSQIFAMLMGQDVTLLRYDAGEMKATATIGPFVFRFAVGPVPMSVSIGGSATLKGRFAMGYDTFGIRQSFQRKQLEPAIVLDALDGVFIDDLDAQGCDVPEITLIGEVLAAAGVDAFVAAAGIDGGLRMTVDLNLDDRPLPDGKLRFIEVLSKISNPICLFDIAGRLDAFLGAWARLGFEWFSKTWRIELVNITLLDFEGACKPPDPRPARIENGNLVVNVGSFGNRMARRIAVAEIDEEVVVRQLNDAGTEFSVTMFGITETYSSVSGNVIIDGDTGEDSISLESGVVREAGPDGEMGTEDDFDRTIAFTTTAIVHGGPGTDTLQGGEGNDMLFGDGDDDRINGNLGDDIIFGGSGNDVLAGELGNDTIHGEGDNDTILGGPGGDMIFGGSGHDDLNGGPGTDNGSGLLFLTDLADTIVGGSGNDVIQGEDGDDQLFGDEQLACNDDGGSDGNDRIDGGPGNDQIFGGNGEDVLGGDEGEDTLCGNGGNDLMDGDDLDDDTPDSDDDLFGGSGDDQLFGRGGHDLLSGQADNDALDGGDDPDDLIGGSGRDIIRGAQGRDVILGDNGQIADAHDPTHSTEEVLNSITPEFGDAEPDIVANCEVSDGQPTLIGQDSSDCLFGGDESDWIFGEGGNDRMFGDAGEGQIVEMINEPHKDYMEGNNGNDVMRGGVDDDLMFGNAGNDEIFGDSGLDRMFGCDLNTPDCYGLTDSDFMRGGVDDDTMEGNADSDTMYGDAGQDDMVGGSSLAGYADSGDVMHGSQGQDVMVGDNAIIERPGGASPADGTIHRIVRRFDIDCPAAVGGDDIMDGDSDNDDMYGACGSDLMHGNEGDDFIEGNNGADNIFGDAGQDDLVGGTGRTVSNDDATAVDGRLDAGDVIYGGDGTADLPEDYDIIIGDNAVIERPLDANGMWQLYSFNGAIVREIFFLDIELSGGNPPVPGSSGGDSLHGEGNDDVMYGQGGDDLMTGGTGEDHMEGNAGGDDMSGNSGNDDMIGGTGRINDDGPLGTNGRADGEDFMNGNDNADIMLGDNGVVSRPLDEQGQWQIDPNTGSVVRQIILLDIESLAAPPVHPDASGSDLMFGGAGPDRMFGQGNTQTDDDGDGKFNEDPPDGMDNDRDGRESAASDFFDCGDGADNDEDGLVDADDPDCAAFIDEDGGGDEMRGGQNIDYMEGNHGSDWMLGGQGEDDMIGGSSSGDGVIGGDVLPTDLRDGHDTISGGEEDDVILGDNAAVVRLEVASGLWLTHSGFGFDLVVRDTTMAQAPEGEGAFGDDYLQGNEGHDELYGQLGGDYAEGNDGSDVLVGDLGKVTTSVEDGSREQTISPPGPFFTEVIYPAGTLHRQTELFSFQEGQGGEGNDILLGGDGRDSIHAGPGSDFANGDGDSLDGEDPNPVTDDEDHIFGGDGDDVMWGGRSHDHLWGGHGNDHLDVRPRVASEVTAPDTPEWFAYGEPDHYQGLDLIYGGWDQDAMQANIAAPGPPQADRLVDWAGGYNVFYVCPGAYGEGTITRQGNPQFRQFLQDVAESDGALLPHDVGTSGFREVGFVFPNERGQNSHPPHPDHPGHFTCDGESMEFGPPCAEKNDPCDVNEDCCSLDCKPNGKCK